MIIRNPAYRCPPDPGALDRYAVNIAPNQSYLGALGFRRRSPFMNIIGRTVKAATGRDLPIGPSPIPAPKPATPTPTRTIAVPGGRTPPLPPGGGLRTQTPGQAAAAAVKEYADVSAYRNILDMLQTFEGVLNRYGQSIARELSCVTNQGLICQGTGGRRGGGYFCTAPPDPEWPFAGSKCGCLLTGAIGYAAKRIGAKNKAEAYEYAKQQCAKNGLRLQQYNVGFFEVPDLLNLARTINYEMNRVRLPVPHNFRQIANAIQGRNYFICPDKHDRLKSVIPPKPTTGKAYRRAHSWHKNKNAIFSQHYINAVELLDVYGNLKKAISAMRVGVRKEIDAANLAAKVEEQTIRREQEALISRQKAAENARKRELEILAEKQRDYERELAEAEKVKAEMAKAKEEMKAELAELAAAREAAQTEQEVEAVEEKAAEVLTAAQLAEQMEQDMTVNAATSAAAAQNVNQQVRQVQSDIVAEREQAVAEGIPVKPKANLTPILLTAAAGFILT